MGEFMGRTYRFDDSNTLTRGAPVPPGYCPSRGECRGAGDVGWSIYSDGDIDSFIRQAEADMEDGFWPAKYGDGTEDEIYLRRIEWNAGLLARIPETHEAYDRPGEPPESVEGWKYIGRFGIEEPAPAWREGRAWASDIADLPDYGVTWCLARPKQVAVCDHRYIRQRREVSVAGPGLISDAGPARTECADCGQTLTEVQLSEVFQRHRSEIDTAADTLEEQADQLESTPTDTTIAPMRPDDRLSPAGIRYAEALALGMTPGEHVKPQVVRDDQGGFLLRVDARDAEAATESLKRSFESLRAHAQKGRVMVLPEGHSTEVIEQPKPPHPGPTPSVHACDDCGVVAEGDDYHICESWVSEGGAWRVVDHPSREERDAAAIERLPGPYDHVWMMPGEDDMSPLLSPGAAEQRGAVQGLKYATKDMLRNSTWMRGGYAPKRTTVVDDMSGDDVAADHECSGSGRWEFL